MIFPYFARHMVRGDSLFYFKQFSLSQEGCAMRIGTDGILLGALAGKDSAPKPEGLMLDLGAGTALVSLMLAQRFPLATIWGLEIDACAVETARLNAKNSPFHDRVHILEGDVNDLDHELASMRFDLIASNPPYFQHSLLAPNKARSQARHQSVSFTFSTLFSVAAGLLSEEGTLAIITPYEALHLLSNEGQRVGLAPTMLLPIQTTSSKPPKRLFSSWKKENDAKVSSMRAFAKNEPFVLHSATGEYSDGYRELTRAFHPHL